MTELRRVAIEEKRRQEGHMKRKLRHREAVADHEWFQGSNDHQEFHVTKRIHA